MSPENTPAESPVEAAPKSSKAPLLLALVNTLAIAGVLGLLVFTRILYQRPVITEHGERERLAQMHASPVPAATPGIVSFEPVTVNIRSTPANPKPADNNQQIQGKLHYVTLGFAVELADIRRKDRLDALKPIIMDRLLAMVGRKGVNELTTVQGRYVLRTELMEMTNRMLGADPKSAVVTNVFFTQFIVQ